MKVTAILMGRGGELDRVTFTPSDPEYWGTDELAAAIAEHAGGHGWTLGNGDTIQISESGE